MAELDVRPLGDLAQDVPSLFWCQVSYGEDDSDGLVDHGVGAHRFVKLGILALQFLHESFGTLLHVFLQRVLSSWIRFVGVGYRRAFAVAP
ncbi:hypothetical protein [Streptomyces sp. NBC_00728]|uniref:hypothetical protein n=1 Tax=Streptomyces sp. NBC_00728 TaxID=2903676 RepID=UPI0038706D41